MGKGEIVREFRKMSEGLFKGIIVFLILGALPAQSQDIEAVKIFKSNKCHECHGLSKFNVKVEDEDPGVKKSAEEEKDSPPDLSTAKIDSTHDLNWTMKYLRKKEEIKNKKHKKKFPGSDSEMELLVKWMISIREK